MPLVFASRHGETNRNFGLLRALAADEPLSPTAFGLSVHNSIAGLWSIIRRESAESVALSAEDDGLEHAFLEAGLLLAQGHEAVLVVLAEERPPRAYQPWIADIPFSYAAAFRLRAGAGWRLAADRGEAGAALWPNPLNLLRHLALGSRKWRHSNQARQWVWTRTA